MIADTRRLTLLLLLLCAPAAGAQDQSGVRVGHWLRIKGRLESPGEFIASEIEVRRPDREESIVATPMNITLDGSRFEMLGLPIETSARTDWHGVAASELGTVQLKVEGHYRGTRRFSANDVESRRSPGRDRIEGRLDFVQRISGALEFRVMNFRVIVASDVPVVADAPLESFELAPVSAAAIQERRNDEDRIVSSIPLGEYFTFGGRVEFKDEYEHEFDLGRKTADGKNARGNRRKRTMTLRGQLVWEPTDNFFALLSAEEGWRNTYESSGGATTRDTDGRINQVYGYWRFPEYGADLQVGRQDFDDDREWLYDKSLDGVRAIISRPGLRIEVSGSSGGPDHSRELRDTNNFMLYVSNNDERKHLAAYVIDRRRSYDMDVDAGGGETKTKTGRDYPIHFGVRALGEWLPDQEVWAEAALIRGYNEGTDYEGWGLDFGSTWSPDSLEPVYLTAGYALTSGDRDPTDDKNTSFQQTGLQDNNGKFGGITSFKYYGEVFEPELSNMSILTVGVGARITRRTSIDLVAHQYNQMTTAPVLSGSSNLRSDPNGNSTDLGWGVDMIVGSREWNTWETELTVGTFHPGAAFDEKKDAWLTKFQLRYRF